MSQNYIIKTQRLGLRAWTEKDCIPFAKINANPKVMRYFPNVLQEEQSNAMVDRLMRHQEEHGFCFYAVDILETGQFIGFIGFACPSFESDFTPCVEIGWRLDNSAWNQGFATEGALACLEYAANQLKINEIYSFTSIHNLPSERIMQKIGMTKVGEFKHPLLEEGDRLQQHVLYKIILS